MNKKTIGCPLPPGKYLSFLRLVCMVLCFFITTLFAEESLAGRCGNLPSGGVTCDGLCWTCRSHLSTYDNPKIQVKYKTEFFLFSVTSSKTLGIGQCKWTVFYGFPIRVCARIALPKHGDPGDNDYYPGDPRPGRYASDSKPYICAYEDPLDGMDTKGGSSPFHQNTNRDQMSARKGATYGALGLGIGASIGALVGAIMSKYNHIVTREIGCEDLPIAWSPPPYKHQIGGGDIFLPPPKVYAVHDSIDVKLETNDSFVTPANPPVSFEEPGARVVTYRNNNFVENYIDLRFKGPPDNPSGEIKNENCTPLNGRSNLRGEKYCTHVYVEKPDEVCVFHADGTCQDHSSCNVIGCVARVDAAGRFDFPLPQVNTVTFPPGTPQSLVDAGKLEVTFGADNAKMTLMSDRNTYNCDNAEDTAITGNHCNCGVLHQVQFCATQKCLKRHPNNTTDSDGNDVSNKCFAFDSDVCLTGYSSDKTVLANKVQRSDGTYKSQGDPDYTEGPIITGPPNRLVSGVWSYDPTNIAPTCVEYCKCNQLDPPAPDGTPVCQESNIEPNSCASTNTGENSYCRTYDMPEITPDKELRAVNAKDLGLCVAGWEKELTTPGTTTIRVPSTCSKIQVELWGAGGNGSSVEGDTNTCDDHFAGGQGSYAHFQLPVKPNEQLKVTVGGKRSGRGESGRDSVIETVSAPVKKVTAGGGKGNAGKCSTNGCKMGNGGTVTESWANATQMSNTRPGTGGNCQWGFGSYGPGGGITAANCQLNQSPNVLGAGGCTKDDDDPNGTPIWGLGADGKVKVRCIPDAEGSSPSATTADNSAQETNATNLWQFLEGKRGQSPLPNLTTVKSSFGDQDDIVTYYVSKTALTNSTTSYYSLSAQDPDNFDAIDYIYYYDNNRSIRVVTKAGSNTLIGWYWFENVAPGNEIGPPNAN